MSDPEHSPSPLHVSPESKKRVAKSDRTRAAILNAALDQIWERPFREMTVRLLMAPTGLSRSAFYQYFEDLHELMETLLEMLQQEIFEAAAPWISGVGDPVALMNDALSGLVRVCHQRGPFLRAIFDAAASDERLANAWDNFLIGFDDAASARIEADQRQGLIPEFDARPVAMALDRLDSYTLIEAFGQHPRSEPEPVREALSRIWISTLYGPGWVGKERSNLVRT
jgi:AcrR family transcriptional regulator